MEEAREARLTVADKKGWGFGERVSQNKAGRGRRRMRRERKRKREVRLGGMGIDEKVSGLEKGKKEKIRKRREEKGKKKAQKGATS